MDSNQMLVVNGVSGPERFTDPCIFRPHPNPRRVRRQGSSFSCAQVTGIINHQICITVGGTNDPSADPNANPGGEGQNNMAEFLAGTEPTNSVSVLQITSITQQGSDVFVSWIMGSGKTNVLQFSAGFAGGGYNTNFADLFPVTKTVGTTSNFLDVGAATNMPSRDCQVRLGPRPLAERKLT